MKKYLLIVPLLLVSFIGLAQADKQIDSTAVFILDKMSSIIGDLESVSFSINNSVDKLDSQNNIVKHYSSSEVSYSGPDRLRVRSNGSKGKIGLFYDGVYLSYYNYDENNYVTLDAPETTIQMIDSMNMHYDFKFPAADFFYPSFTDDMIEQFDSIQFLGATSIEGDTCYHILASNDNLSVQIWVSNNTYLLPKRFVILYKNKSNMQYESSFSDWKLNPNIPDAVFDFVPPPSARLISILKKS